MIDKQNIVSVLHELFDVPFTVADDQDLREYMHDSIDVGEYIAVMHDRYSIELKLRDFESVYTLEELIQITNKNHETL